MTKNHRHVLKRTERELWECAFRQSESQDEVSAHKACRHVYGQEQWLLLQ